MYGSIVEKERIKRLRYFIPSRNLSCRKQLESIRFKDFKFGVWITVEVCSNQNAFGLMSRQVDFFSEYRLFLYIW